INCLWAALSALLRLKSVLNTTVSTSSSTATGRARRRSEARSGLRPLTCSTTSSQRLRSAAVACGAGDAVLLVGTSAGTLTVAGTAGGTLLRVGTGGDALAVGAEGSLGAGAGGWGTGTTRVGGPATASTSHAVSRATSVCTWNCCASRVLAKASESVWTRRVSVPPDQAGARSRSQAASSGGRPSPRRPAARPRDARQLPCAEATARADARPAPRRIGAGRPHPPTHQT